MAFNYYSPLSINSAQVPSTQTDFPVLVSLTDARFKTVGNGGHVENASGFDIRPYSDSALTTAITGYELERFNASTGEVIMWVKVASLSSSTTPIYLAYGDASLTTDGSSNTTWSNSFVDVYHLKDGTTLNLNSSVSGGHNLSNSAVVTATTGQIDGAAGFASASSQSLDTASLTTVTATTVSAWVKATSFPTAYNSVVARNPNNSTFFAVFVKSNGKVGWFLSTGAVSQDGTGSHTLSTATWYYLTMTYDNSAGLVGYVNAASDATHAAGGAMGSLNTQTQIGEDSLNNPRYWNGVIDEVRLASVARSANWVTTEYNNQSAPGTFETLGTEVVLIVAATGNFFALF